VHADGSGLRLAATDISNHLACRHLTQLDRAVAEGRLSAPAWRDPALELLQQRGLAHERAYLEHLRARGLKLAEPESEDGRLPQARVLEAMRAGAEVIVQAELGHERWAGRADVLLRVEKPSDLGPWSYEAADTKLAQETRAGTILQLCLYSELLAGLQGRAPERMHVVKPVPGFQPESFRLDDFGAYYRLVRRRLEEVIAAPPDPGTYPYPVPHCDACRWWRECDARRHADDHLCLVAGIRPLHVAELEAQGVRTLRQFAESPRPLARKPERGSPEAFARAHGQARVQLEGREAGQPRYRFLPLEPGRGFFRLPEPNPGDLFFDFEADPFVGEGGLEYLFGVAFADAAAEEGGAWQYRGTWALDRGQERAALEQFLGFVMERWAAHPGMHVYHFSPYEPAAVKRLIGRHGTREAELDRLLRAGRFVDLMAVTRQGLQASVESYSLKELEALYGFARAQDLRAAGSALRRIDRALELAGVADITDADRAQVQRYNRDDCLSTAALRDWLEARRAELESRGQKVARPLEESGEASAAVEQKAAEVQEVYEQLTRGLDGDRASWGTEERARWLLAHQLEYFRREDKSAWWEYFRIHDLDPEELLEERKAIAALQFLGQGSGARVHRYRFPPQEVAAEPGDELHEIGGGSVGRVQALDLATHTLEIAKYAKAAAVHPAAVMVNERVPPSPVDRSLLQFAVSVARYGARGPYAAGWDLLCASRPRLSPPAEGPLRRAGEDALEAAVRLARSLNSGILPIQGPPGSGKTYTGARLITALAREGCSIGVTAVSHKVIRNLLGKAREAAGQAGWDLPAAHKVGRQEADAPGGIEQVADNARAFALLKSGAVVGGTAWFWSRDELAESLDYLFVDEAGQISLAQALAMARSARNLVLLGDPQQLEQPQRGAHPEGAEVAALVHLLGGRQTLAEEAGLFLDKSWRLHPSICAFTSELFYEGRLASRPGLEKQALGGGTPFAGSGLFYVPVEHKGNQASSPEEAKTVARIAEGLLAPQVRWTDKEGEARRLLGSDLLVVAPYNAQVAAIARLVPAGVRVGTVDKFQGQEAPVVIYSMASSSAQDAPRGMDFLYNPNRLNVATSRARAACILVATRRVLEPECRSPEQMRRANALCRYRELAAEVRRV
jgi:predicted RecB family nuclease